MYSVAEQVLFLHMEELLTMRNVLGLLRTAQVIISDLLLEKVQDFGIRWILFSVLSIYRSCFLDLRAVCA
jgi:hypothetical protein